MTNVIPLRPTSAESAPVERAVYTVAEVAVLLDLSLGLAYALVRDGTIPARKLGGTWKVPKAAFHAWLNASTTEDKDAI
jgi:excisionase family DNA binding protein